MRKFSLSLLLVSLAPLSSAAPATVVGSDAAACTAGRPSIEVVVSGFKQATGTIKISLYGSDPARYLAHHGKLRNVIVPVRSTAPMDVCIAVPAPGVYAVALHHDLNGNGDKDRADGGGYSRNPHLSILNLKPPLSQTGIRVGEGPTRAPVTLMYVHGLSIGPVRS